MQFLFLAIVASVAYGVYFFLRALFSPTRGVPGPFLAKFTDYWYFRQVNAGHIEEKNRELHRTYGPVVRYGRNRFSFDDPEAIKIIYGHGTQFAKSSFYDTFTIPGIWNVFTERSIKFHAQLRRGYQATYSMSSLVNYEPFVDNCADVFDQRLNESAAAGIAVDIGHWFQCYAFDVIGEITFAERLGYLDRGEDIGDVIKSLEGTFHYASTFGIYAALHPYMLALHKFIGRLTNRNDEASGFSYVLNVTMKKIEAHKAKPAAVYEEHKDGSEAFVSKFLKQHANDPDKFTTLHVLQGCGMNIGAGSDTTAISLSATLYYLLKNPECMKKLQKEISNFEKEGKLSQSPTFKESQDMPYLQAVIKEALRIHPAVGQPLERVVPEGGATISGTFFPPGTIVGVNCWVAQRNKAVWGEDADDFKPERWLINDAEKLAIMNRNWIPFGVGSRTCIGRHISMLEMCKLIPRIIRDFDFQLDGDGRADWKTTAYWFVKPQGFKVKVAPRTLKA